MTAQSVWEKQTTRFLCKLRKKPVVAKTTKLVNVMHHSRAFMNILREFKAIFTINFVVKLIIVLPEKTSIFLLMAVPRQR